VTDSVARMSSRMSSSPSVTDRALRVIPVPVMGAEDVAVTDDGDVFTGTEDGSVFRISPDGSRVQRVGNTGGRPLGIELLPDGRLLVCDPSRGLLRLDPSSGEVETLLEEVDGQRMLVCNNAAVANDGTIYFSDSSRVHPLERWRADIAEDTCSGRLIRLRPTDDGGWSRPEVLVSGLRFANGVALSADESFVCVAESRGRTVVRRWLTGPRRGQVDHLVTDLPGYPDNIARGSDGLIWVTLGGPTLWLLENLVPRLPLALRKLITRLPEALQPKERPTVRVMAYDEHGALLHDVDLEPDGFHFVTGVREHRGRVWLGSLHHAAVAHFDL
jgi:sugar lactone lactonase YvrE